MVFPYLSPIALPLSSIRRDMNRLERDVFEELKADYEFEEERAIAIVALVREAILQEIEDEKPIEKEPERDVTERIKEVASKSDFRVLPDHTRVDCLNIRCSLCGYTYTVVLSAFKEPDDSILITMLGRELANHKMKHLNAYGHISTSSSQFPSTASMIKAARSRARHPQPYTEIRYK